MKQKLYICVQVSTENIFFCYLIKNINIQMKKVYTYKISTSVSPMGYMGAPAAYDCSLAGIGISKLKV